jgi:prephenate dehydratase
MERIVYSGEPGAFAEDAMLAYYREPAGVPVAGFRAAFVAVAAGRLSSDAEHAAPIVAGVLPIENVVNGTVRETYDLLLEHDLVITGEVVVPVRLCLAALPGEPLESIERVYSHIQALGQAETFLRSRPWELLSTYNTAGAAKGIVERGERQAAALLSPRAAALFGLEILADNVQDVADNRTRFLVLERPEVVAERRATAVSLPGEARPRHDGPTRSTLVIGLRNEPGSLHRCLGVLARAALNMSKLESRPVRGRSWEYVFWIDLDADADAPVGRAAIADLAKEAAWVRVLGSYPLAEEPG